MKEKAASNRMVKIAYAALDEKKASDISVIDISDLTVIADYFIIASAENVRQTYAMYENVQEKLHQAGFDPRQVEGIREANWILMDYGDVIVHIFDRENRLFYDIERIWRDGKKIVDPAALTEE